MRTNWYEMLNSKESTQDLNFLCICCGSIDQFRYIKIHTWLGGLRNKTKEIILRLSNE